MSDSDASAAFWAWWERHRSELAKRGGQHDFAADEALAERVAALHPTVEVTGTFLPGGDSWLCLSSRGNIEVRNRVEQLVARAPKHDVRLLTARPPRWPPPGETPFAFEGVCVVLERDTLREMIDLTLYHPSLAVMDAVDRSLAAFSVLDHLLGEDDVERWVGTIDVSLEPLDNALPIEALKGEVAALAADATAERWQAVTSGTRNHPVVVTVNRALKPIDHVALTTHVRIDIELRSPGPRGLAHTKEEIQLSALQAELTRELGTRVVVVARETQRGHRIVHLHAEPGAHREITAWRLKHAEWAMTVLEQPDPKWEILRRWDVPLFESDAPPPVVGAS
jgi:hypothetical protein